MLKTALTALAISFAATAASAQCTTDKPKDQKTSETTVSDTKKPS